MSPWRSDEERLLRYFNYVERTLEKMRLKPSQRFRSQVEAIIDNAKRYYKDARHYARLGDYSTSYVCVAYCEGLLDCLKYLGLMEVEGEVVVERRKKVMVAGVFDIIHPGHIFLISKAAELGDVVVVVARDSTVQRLKGRRPVVPEVQRLEVVKNIKGVKEAVLGNEGEDMLKIVEELRPDVIMLGPNQDFDEEKLRKGLEERGLRIEVVRLKELYEAYKLCSTTKIIKEILTREDLQKLVVELNRQGSCSS